MPGTACDDGNPNSSNDVYDANCNCSGTLPNDCLGVPGGTAQPGTACDDGNANTGNDLWDANCVCVGQLIDCMGVPGGSALPGTACNDGNANTGNDTWSANCTCVGQLIDCLGVPGGSALPGTACDDGNPNSSNDAYDANCNCVGQLANDCLGVPGGPAQPGTPCDDGNANTGNDLWDANCVCVGQLIDCLGVPGGSALPGTACNDGNANTGNDTWSANCTCAGQLIDCLGVPGGSALPGTACNDGDACTTGDVYDANCNCAGLFADADNDGTCDANDVCPNSPEPGQSCDDGDACTINDVVGANCNCAGTFADDDNDGTCDADDLCPGSPEPGQACNDGNPLTINDVVDANCTCAGTPIGNCTEILTLDITLDNNGSETTWEVRDQSGTTVIASGGPYQNGVGGTIVTETICLNQLCYRLVVNDAGGDGISGGGYVLRDANGRRIVDANGSFVSTSSVANEFCLPLSAARLINASCDRTNLTYSSSTQIYASFYPGASGYQFWMFDPHGSYSRRVFKTTQNLVPATLVTNPVPADIDLNVRVRALVNGNYTEFGPACRFRLNTPGGGGREAILFDEASNVTMSLYPNPNRGEVVNVAFDGIAAAERMDIEVMDIFGKRVSAAQIAAPGGAFVHTMDMSQLAPGVYMVNVRVDDRLYTQRMVRQ
ncbi:MAG: T9SS type A sorting domain-containing protein [Flavobacteriales bacterium]|nr:T9SS type A sorting domain-containing protein [Flavobacteriales bacterium]